MVEASGEGRERNESKNECVNCRHMQYQAVRGVWALCERRGESVYRERDQSEYEIGKRTGESRATKPGGIERSQGKITRANEFASSQTGTKVHHRWNKLGGEKREIDKPTIRQSIGSKKLANDQS